MLTAWLSDIRLAFRQLIKRPAFTFVAAGTLALGIGAATALFSVVYGVLISPYPYAAPGEIWAFGVSAQAGPQRLRPFRYDAFDEMTRLPAMAAVMATSPGSRLLTGTFAPETVTAIEVSGNAFGFLGVAPVMGRVIQPTDILPDGQARPVAVLSFRRWQETFAGASDVLGKTLRLDDVDHEVIGVMPSRFGWWTSDGVWVPLGRSAPDKQVFPIARLRDGTSIDAATEQWTAMVPGLAAAHPGEYPRDGARGILTNYLDVTVASGPMQQALRLLFGAVVLLLLIACANVANLQLARASARGREMAVRASLGAGRAQIMRQLLTESVALALLGGVAGLACAQVIIRVMVGLMPDFFIPNEARIELNGLALLFCTLVSLASGVLFGLMPALHTSRPDLTTTLKEEARGSSGGRRELTRGLLVVGEVAVSVVLLVSAAMTVRTFLGLQRVDLGFDPEGVVSVGLPLAPRTYDSLESRNRFARELIDRVRALPGVDAVNIGNGGTPFGGPQSAYAIDGQPAADGQRLRVYLAGEDYWRVLRVPIRKGRALTDREVAAGDNAAVINEAAAALWPAGIDPIGRQVRIDLLRGPLPADIHVKENTSSQFTVVGIMANARNDGVGNEVQPAAVLPYTLVAPPQRTLAVRTTGVAAPLVNAIRTQMQQLDPLQPLGRPFTLAEIVARESAQPRFTMALFAAFGMLGLVLAMAGLYSVLAYLVSMRRREIGIRMALGAQPAQIVRDVGRAGLGLVAIGLAVGGLGSVLLLKLLASQLSAFAGDGLDPLTFTMVAALLGVAALMACVVPARRAARVQPTDAMR